MNAVRISAAATYLPAFEAPRGRLAGPDEDAVTMAVEAGRQAIVAAAEKVEEVIVVTRDFSLLRGGSAAVIAAGLGLDDDVRVAEQLGGGPETLDTILAARPGTLVVGADVTTPAGAAAVMVAVDGALLGRKARVARSLPMRVSSADGGVHDYDDPRLLRERGTRASLDTAALDSPLTVLAGATGKGLRDLVGADQPRLPTSGASSPIFALAGMLESGVEGSVGALENAQLSVASLEPGVGAVVREERPPRPLPRQRLGSPGNIKISMPAYDRAFDAKVRLAAGRCPRCGTLALPPRWRCLSCGREGRQELVPLARTGTVYTTTTVHVAVPGIATPYSLAIVAIDGGEVRLLAHVTEAEPGSVSIGDQGSLVLRRVATRDGVPDYGFAFRPEPEGDEG